MRRDLQHEWTLGYKSDATIHLWAPIHILSGREDYQLLCGYFGISQYDFSELFLENGCGNARSDSKGAAAYIEAFVARKWPKTQLDPGFIRLRDSLMIPEGEPA